MTDRDITAAPRGFWARLADRVTRAMQSGGLAGLFDRGVPPERSVGFTIAVIALGAKVAKADGRVHQSEVAAFRRIFEVSEADVVHAGRVFDLARQDVAGFDLWAARVARLFPPGDPVLTDVLEGLWIVAAADGHLADAERAVLAEIARIFHITPAEAAAIRARHDSGEACEPWRVLGIAPDTPLAQARTRWRALVREAHPDRASARGLPPEAALLAQARTAALNAAWDSYRALHRAPVAEPGGGTKD